MIRKEIILTTEPERFTVENVFHSNDVLNLPMPAEGDPIALGALTWIADVEAGRPKEVGWACLERAVQQLACILPQYSLWLCATESGPSNAAVKYRGLWKSLLSRSSTTAPNAPLGTEICVETDDGRLFFFGCVQVTHDELSFAHSIVDASPRAFLMALPTGREPVLGDMIACGWRYGFSRIEELRDLALYAAGQHGILFRLFGEFDDKEAGVHCLMRSDLLPRIIDTA